MDRMQKLAVVASVQPSWIHLFGDGYERAVGAEATRRSIPVRSFLNRGIPVAFSSDVPATMVFEPSWGIIGAVTRRTRQGRVLVPAEAITMKEALRAYTAAAACAAFEEPQKGSIEAGKLADLAVWEQDLCAVRPEPIAIRNLKVVVTILDGKVVYSDPRSGLAVRTG
jgi:predicted amidohydrolase YtcJ